MDSLQKKMLIRAVLSPPTVSLPFLLVGGGKRSKPLPIKAQPTTTSCRLCGDDAVPLLGTGGVDLADTLRTIMTKVGLELEEDLIFCPFCSSQLLHLVALKREINALGERLASMIIGLRGLLPSPKPRSEDLHPCDEEAAEEEEMPFEEDDFDIKPELMETISQEDEEGAIMMDDDLEATPTDSPHPPLSPNVNHSGPTSHEERTGEEEDNVTLWPAQFLAKGKEEEGQTRRSTANGNGRMDSVTPPSPLNEKATPSSNEGEIGDLAKVGTRRKGPIVQRSLCPTCGKTFPFGAPYKRHFLTHSVDKPHSCHLCHKSFATQRWLRIHVKITHTPGGNVKSFACPTCQKTFRTSGDLRQHSLTHGGVNKPFVCQICGRTFIRHSDLKSHTLIHTRNQPHVCHICPSSFRLTGHLQRHLTMYHPRALTPKNHRPSRIKHVFSNPFPHAELDSRGT